MIGVERGFALEDADGTVRHLREVWSDDAVRMNEGGCDPDGRFYCGSMAYDQEPGAASLYRLDPDLSVHVVLERVTVSNGLEWSPDGSRAYYNDTATHEVAVFDYDSEAGLTGRRAFVRTPQPARPDGLTVDAEGGVWVALSTRRRRAPLQPGRQARRGGGGGGPEGHGLHLRRHRPSTSCSSPPPARASNPARIRWPARCSASFPASPACPSASSPDEARGRPAVIESLVLFGASGDLAGRFLLPALAALRASGRLPDNLGVVGAARSDWDDRAFQRHAEQRLEEHASDVPLAARDALIHGLRYRQVDLEDAGSVAGVIDTAGQRPLAAYLALPPRLFPVTITALRRVGLPPGSRVAVENPFGEDLDGAIALNALLAEVTGEAGEQAVFRVDHVLGMETVQNLLGLRLANRLLEPVWNRACIEEIAVLWEETLALEGRAGYYDGTGALKDVLQTHMLQVLCLLAMEPPATLDERDLRDAKVAVLRSLRPPEHGDDGFADPPRPLRRRSGRRPGGSRLRRRARRGPAARHRDVRGGRLLAR